MERVGVAGSAFRSVDETGLGSSPSWGEVIVDRLDQGLHAAAMTSLGLLGEAHGQRREPSRS